MSLMSLDRLRRRRASAYRAGADLDDALAACGRLRDYGLAATIGYGATPEEPARSVADVHLAAFRRVAEAGLDCHVSVKLSALGFDAELVAELRRAARRTGRRLHLDALAPDTVDRTWLLLGDGPADGLLGVTLPGRWGRSVDDAARAARLGFAVRVVKGQWPDDRDGGIDAARGFLEVVDRLCDHTADVGVATHDVALLAEALGRLTAAATPCTTELFLGLPFRAPALTARRLGVPVRVYVPYGHGGAPYGVADVAGRPEVARWLLEDLLLGTDKTWRSIRRSEPRR